MFLKGIVNKLITVTLIHSIIVFPTTRCFKQRVYTVPFSTASGHLIDSQKQESKESVNQGKVV